MCTNIFIILCKYFLKLLPRAIFFVNIINKVLLSDDRESRFRKMRESIFRRTITRFVTVDVKETPCTEQATTYVVVVRVNGSHLIKNYLITFLALIRYAWFSLSRAPRLPRHSYLLLTRSLPISLLLSHPSIAIAF